MCKLMSFRSASGGPDQRNEVDVHVGGQLRIARHNIGGTVEQSARALLLSTEEYCAIENGTRRLSATEMFAACTYFGVEVLWFFKEMTSPNRRNN